MESSENGIVIFLEIIRLTAFTSIRIRKTLYHEDNLHRQVYLEARRNSIGPRKVFDEIKM